MIAFRRGNKVGVRISLTPTQDVSNVRPTAVCPLTPVHEDSELVFEQFERDQLVPLRAALCLHFDYKNTTTSLLSEQRAAAAAAAAAANASASATSAVKAGAAGDTKLDALNGKSTTAAPSPTVLTGVTSPTGTIDQIQQVDLVVLLNFGDMVLKH